MSSKATPGPWSAADRYDPLHTVCWMPSRDLYIVSDAQVGDAREDAALLAAAPALRDAAIAEERATKHRDDCAYCDMGDSTCGVYSNLRRDAEIARRAALAACEPQERSR